MTFRVKNLMIQVLPGEGEQPQQDVQANCSINNFIASICGGTCQNKRNQTLLIPTVFFHSIWCPHPPVEPTTPQSLAELKVQLQDALKSVEEQEKALNEQTSIKTVEQAQMLETHLQEALEEVQRQKQALQQQSDSTPQEPQ